jgi:hypothetical protein
LREQQGQKKVRVDTFKIQDAAVNKSGGGKKDKVRRRRRAEAKEPAEENGPAHVLDFHTTGN